MKKEIKKNSDNKKNNIIIIAIVLVILLGIGIYFIVNKNKDTDGKKYNNVFTYIKDQENVTAVINYCDPKGIKNGEYALYENNLTNVLQKLENSQMNYLDNIVNSPCQTEIYFRYKKDEKETHVSLILEENYALINSTDDENIHKIYDNNFKGDTKSYTFNVNSNDIIKEIIG